MTAGLVVLTAGVAWAGPHGGVAATVAQDGTFVFTTTNGPAASDIDVSAASYTGLWKNQTEPEQLFRVVHGTIAAGTSRLVLHVEVPSCGPYQLDAFLGTQVPATISFPQGSGPNGLKGQEYPNGAPCATSTPDPDTDADARVRRLCRPRRPRPRRTRRRACSARSWQPTQGLAATGSDGVRPATMLGIGLLVVGLGAVAVARRPRRH